MASTRVADKPGGETSLSSSTGQARDGEVSHPRSSSSIRFTPDATAPSSRPSRRVASSSDEATPIRQSESHVNRSYNTSDATLILPSPQPTAITPAFSQQTDSSGVTKGEKESPWYKRVAEKYGSITLENKASVARDHLALERTFLAWLRTSLSFASIGIAVTQLFRLNSTLSSRQNRRAHYEPTLGSTSSSVPFSPFVGHTIPAEVLPYLQYVAAVAEQSMPRPKLGPTLLDQLMSLSPDGKPVNTGGFSITQFDETSANKLKHVGKPLGATFIGISIIVLLVGFQRYFEAQHWIIHGKFPASRGSISLVAFIAFALIIASLVIVIVVSPHSYER